MKTKECNSIKPNKKQRLGVCSKDIFFFARFNCIRFQVMWDIKEH